MNKLALIFFVFLSQFAHATDFRPVDTLNDVQSLKTEILKIAEFYTGQGDPDYKIQNTLDPYVEKLVKLAPQKPAGERIDMIAGRWQQVWGPYDNRSDDRGVDPSFDPDNVFQVVSPDSYYWNVGKSLNKKGKVKRIGLLRGEFKAGKGDKLNIRFTNLKGIKPKKVPQGLKLTDLPYYAERKELKGMRSILPAIIVRLFFGKGFLEEVYTDEDIRLTYGTDNKDNLDRYLFVLKRVP